MAFWFRDIQLTQTSTAQSGIERADISPTAKGGGMGSRGIFYNFGNGTDWGKYALIALGVVGLGWVLLRHKKHKL